MIHIKTILPLLILLPKYSALNSDQYDGDEMKHNIPRSSRGSVRFQPPAVELYSPTSSNSGQYIPRGRYRYNHPPAAEIYSPIPVAIVFEDQGLRRDKSIADKVSTDLLNEGKIVSKNQSPKLTTPTNYNDDIEVKMTEHYKSVENNVETNSTLAHRQRITEEIKDKDINSVNSTTFNAARTKPYKTLSRNVVKQSHLRPNFKNEVQIPVVTGMPSFSSRKTSSKTPTLNSSEDSTSTLRGHNSQKKMIQTDISNIQMERQFSPRILPKNEIQSPNKNQTIQTSNPENEVTTPVTIPAKSASFRRTSSKVPTKSSSDDLIISPDDDDIQIKPFKSDINNLQKSFSPSFRNSQGEIETLKTIALNQSKLKYDSKNEDTTSVITVEQSKTSRRTFSEAENVSRSEDSIISVFRDGDSRTKQFQGDVSLMQRQLTPTIIPQSQIQTSTIQTPPLKEILTKDKFSFVENITQKVNPSLKNEDQIPVDKNKESSILNTTFSDITTIDSKKDMMTSNSGSSHMQIKSNAEKQLLHKTSAQHEIQIPVAISLQPASTKLNLPQNLSNKMITNVQKPENKIRLPDNKNKQSNPPKSTTSETKITEQRKDPNTSNPHNDNTLTIYHKSQENNMQRQLPPTKYTQSNIQAPISNKNIQTNDYSKDSISTKPNIITNSRLEPPSTIISNTEEMEKSNSQVHASQIKNGSNIDIQDINKNELLMTSKQMSANNVHKQLKFGPQTELQIPVSIIYDEPIKSRNYIKTDNLDKTTQTREIHKNPDQKFRQKIQGKTDNKKTSDTNPIPAIETSLSNQTIQDSLMLNENVTMKQSETSKKGHRNNKMTRTEHEKISKIRERDPVVPIVESANRIYSHNGEFVYSYEGGDGTKAFEMGELKHFDDDKTGEAVVGGFSYKDKEGNDFSLTYTADENGYRPIGAHLPTPPPIPPAIARALAYLATKSTPEPEPVTETITVSI